MIFLMSEEVTSGKFSRRDLLKGLFGAAILGLTDSRPREANADTISIEQLQSAIDKENQEIKNLVEPLVARFLEVGEDAALIDQIRGEVESLTDLVNHTSIRFENIWALAGRTGELPESVFLPGSILSVLHLADHPDIEFKEKGLSGYFESVRSASSESGTRNTPIFVSGGIQYDLLGNIDPNGLSFNTEYKVDGHRFQNGHNNLIAATQLVH